MIQPRAVASAVLSPWSSTLAVQVGDRSASLSAATCHSSPDKDQSEWQIDWQTARESILPNCATVA